MHVLVRVVLLMVIIGSIDMPVRGQVGDAPRLDVTTEEILVVGDDPSLPAEYLLGRPQMVRTDSEGNIYVADGHDMTIKVYDEDGRPLHMIGTRGRGPGEFQRFSAMHVDLKDRLIVADHFQRRVTVFSREGEVLETVSVEGTINWPRYLDQLPGGNFVFLFKMPEEMRSSSGPSPLIHLFNGAFEHVTSLGRQDRTAPSEDTFGRRHAGFHAGRIAISSSGDIIYVPQLYEGKLYRFQKTGGQWRLAATFQGVVREPSAYTPVEVPNLADYEERPDYPAGVALIHSGGESLGARIHNESKGVFVRSDGRIVHFTFIRSGDRRVFGAELFGEEGALRGYVPIDAYTSEKDGRTVALFQIGWKDARDRFYILDRREHPVVRVVKFDFETTNSR